MQVVNKSDSPVSDASCKAATGKTLKQWFKVLDQQDGLKQGRRASVQSIYSECDDPWWATTIYVEYEAHQGVKKKDGLAEGYTICVTKTVNASIEKVYQVWTSAAGFAAAFGDGGRQSVKDGGELSCQAGCHGTFTRVRPNKDLRLAWEHPECSAKMQVDIQFQDAKGKCLMNVMTSRIQTRAEADGLRNAWTEVLNRLKSLCEK